MINATVYYAIRQLDPLPQHLHLANKNVIFEGIIPNYGLVGQGSSLEELINNLLVNFSPNPDIESITSVSNIIARSGYSWNVAYISINPDLYKT